MLFSSLDTFAEVLSASLSPICESARGGGGTGINTSEVSTELESGGRNDTASRWQLYRGRVG